MGTLVVIVVIMIILSSVLGKKEKREELKKETNLKTIQNDFPIVPEHFTDPEEARAYVTKHQIFGYGGFDPYKMSDEDILNFANEMINQAELLGYKYMKEKNK